MNLRLSTTGLFLLILISYPATSALAAETGHTRPGRETMVRFEDGVSITKQKEILKAQGLREIWRSNLVTGLIAAEPMKRDDAREARFLPRLRQSLNRLGEIRYAEPNFRIRRFFKLRLPRLRDSRRSASDLAASSARKSFPRLAPNDPMLNRQWALVGTYGIEPQEAWNILSTSDEAAEVKVAVIDTGIDTEHPDLEGRILPGYDFIDDTDEMHDGAGHGTHVSGIIAAGFGNRVGIAGIAPTAKIIPLRAVPDDGDETDLDVMRSFEFAAAAGARVANCSFGKEESSRAVAEVIEAAGRAGVLAVVAAGNDSADNNRSPSYPVNFKTSNMIAVASSASNGRLSYFSNYGMGIVDLAAPGSKILSTVPDGDYDRYDGTSMASPQVAGVAALVLSVVPELTTSELKQLLLETVTERSSLRRRVTTGGALNASAAVQAALDLRRSRLQ